MKTAALALVGLAAFSQPASAATRNYGVSGFDRIRLDGDYKVTVTNGVAPFARATGSPRGLDLVSVKVEGRTLVVKTSRSANWGGFATDDVGPVTIEVGTHELSAVYVNGAGALAINRADGLKFDISAQGAGMVAIDKLEVDQLGLSLAGSSTARLGGKVGKATIVARGSSALDGETLSVKDVVVGAQGPTTIKLTATGTAKVDAAGVASVTLGGKPSCTTTTQGSASVSGCKQARW